MRNADVTRKTTETNIELSVNLDGAGCAEIETGCGFLNHMLELFSRHGSFDVKLRCTGDAQVDYHHTAEDVGIVLGRAFSSALQDRAGITRYGSFLLPMDEALVMVAVDISGRGTLMYKLNVPAEKVGDMDTECIREFFEAFSRELGLTMHLHQMAGENTHHIFEAAFKGLARALAQAVRIDENNAEKIPSTKGTIL